MIVKVKRCEFESGIGVKSLSNTAPGEAKVWPPNLHAMECTSVMTIDPPTVFFFTQEMGLLAPGRRGNRLKPWAGSDLTWAPSEMGWAASHRSLRE